MKPGVPAGLPVITLPLAPETRGRSAGTTSSRAPRRSQGEPDRALDELATIVYTSGSTGQPKGVMQSFRSFNIVGTLMHDVMSAGPDDRMLSYLPLAHVAERLVVREPVDLPRLSGVLRRVARHLRRGPAARTSHHLLLRAAAVDQVRQRGARQAAAEASRTSCSGSRSSGVASSARSSQQLGLDSVRLAFTGAAPLPPGDHRLVPRPRPRAARGLRDEREHGLLALHAARSARASATSGRRTPASSAASATTARSW